MITSYKQLIKFVDDFAYQHQQIQRFRAEFEEQMPNFATENEAYPILFMSPIGSQFKDNEDTYTVRFYCFDIIQKDRANINFILSDTNLILNDLKKWFKDGDNYTLDILNDPTATPINNALLDYVAGWQMDITFNVDTYCFNEIPFKESPLIPVEGYDVVYSQYLTCNTVTGCTTLQNYVENAISNSGGGGNDQYWISGTTGNFSLKTKNLTDTDATGNYALAEGLDTLASGVASHAQNSYTIAAGNSSHAEGYNTESSGFASHTEGNGTQATAFASHAQGNETNADGLYSHAEGNNTLANGEGSHAQGSGTTSVGLYSHAQGIGTIASGTTSHTQGSGTTANGIASHAEGNNTLANGISSHAEGNSTTANGNYSHSEGDGNLASGIASHAEGNRTTASGNNSHAQGVGTTASGDNSFASGDGSIASGDNSYAGGFLSEATGVNSFVHGNESTASGNGTVVFGSNIVGTDDNTVYLPNIQFDLTSPSTMSEGRMEWNSEDGTVDLRLKGNNVTLQIGQEEVIRVVNKTGANLLESDYKVVRVRTASEGGAQGQRLAVVLAQANSRDNHRGILGIVTENITDNQEGFITSFGQVRNINTTGSLQGETWVDGDSIYLSETNAGGLTNILPTTHPVMIGYVLYSHAINGKIFVKINDGVDELTELHDVSISGTPTNNQVLAYSDSLSAWTNTTISGGGSTSDDISNESTVSGTTVTDALNNVVAKTDMVRYVETATSSLITGDDTVQKVRSQLIPANTFEAGWELLVRQRVRKASGSSSWVIGFYINTSDDIAGATQLAQYTNTGAAPFSQMKRDIVIKGANTEVFRANSNAATDDISSGSDVSSIAIDWTQDQYFIFSLDPGSSTDSFYHSFYIIEGRKTL